MPLYNGRRNPLRRCSGRHGHSTKGRIKIPLEKAALSIDDVAYFVESYVHRELYAKHGAENKRRFYVKAFAGLDPGGNQAVVRFTVLDLKENRTFPDRMTIFRGDDGLWRYAPGGGDEVVPLYTYVKKWGYYYQRYIQPFSLIGAGIAVAALVLLRIRRRKQHG